MKRHILEITEIDCGDETCDGCEWDIQEGVSDFCRRLTKPLGYDWPIKRLPECLEAERAYKDIEPLLRKIREEK